jgi:hypothetical protein
MVTRSIDLPADDGVALHPTHASVVARHQRQVAEMARAGALGTTCDSGRGRGGGGGDGELR